MVDVHTHRLFWTVHKYAGLVAAAWLLVLGVTGVLLDHHEWRWLSQNSVPTTWTSKQINRLVPGTVMRYAVATSTTIVGGSERGTWLSPDKGKTWTKVAFEGLKGQPQLFGFAGSAGASFSGVYLATDDGLWTLTPDGAAARRIALKGQHLTSISPGHDGATLVVVRDHSDLLTIEKTTGKVTEITRTDDVNGLTETVAFNTFIREIHFGRGLLAGGKSIWINDLAGIALIALSLSGIGYWLIKRNGKQLGLSVPARRGSLKWLFRSHGPTLGLIGAIPVLILAVTAFALNHIYGFIDATKGWEVPRASLPPAYQASNLDGEIDGVAAWPGQPGRLSISSRFGVLQSLDNGRSWRTEPSIPDPSGMAGANLFRVDESVFVGRGGDRNVVQAGGAGGWQFLKGLPTGITSATRQGDQWLLKNSRGFYLADANKGSIRKADIQFKNAVAGTTLFLFAADIHAGVIFHEQFKWLNDVFAVLAVLLVISGPVIWLRRKWV
jgi:uncharacterized iron-regulated membrane protein